jgi:hypothetical protein
MTARSGPRAGSALRWLAAGAVVALLMWVVDPWLDRSLRSAEVQHRLGELGAQCQAAQLLAQQTLSRVEASRADGAGHRSSAVFTPLEPITVVRSESGDPILSNLEERLLALEDEALRYRSLVQQARRLEQGAADSSSRVDELLDEAQRALALHVDSLERTCAELRAEGASAS